MYTVCVCLQFTFITFSYETNTSIQSLNNLDIKESLLVDFLSDGWPCVFFRELLRDESGPIQTVFVCLHVGFF